MSKHRVLSKSTVILALLAFMSLTLSLYLGDIQSDSLLEETQMGDSFYPLYLALTHDGELSELYDDIFFTQKVKFQYPPTALLFFMPFRTMEGDSFIYLFSNIVNKSLIVLTLISLVVLFWFTVITKEDSFADLIFKTVSFCVLVMTFYPLFFPLTIGQIQVAINLFLITSIIAVYLRRERLAGILIGLCALIKPTFLVVIIWSYLRRRYTLFYSSLITVISAAVLSLIIFGWKIYVDYFQVLSFIGKHGESYYANQSFNGLMHRMLMNGNNLIWDANQFPPFNEVVYLSTLLVSTGLLFSAFFLLRRRGGIHDILDFALILLTTTIISPIAWEHHYGYSIALYMVLFTSMRSKRAPWYLSIAAVLSFTLMSHFYLGVNALFAETQFNFLQSYLFFGALILLFLFYTLRSKYNTSFRL